MSKPFAIVTGASSGIGLELATICAQEGFDLLVAADRPEIEPAAAQFRDFGAQVSSLQVDRVEGHLVFDNVDFRYPNGAPLLTGVSFHASPGETVALVGMSGAGKTTIASLIMRLHDVSGGRVLIDGRDIRTVTRRSLRQSIAYVSQETVAFSGTIRDNLRYGRLDATDQEIERAARAACAHDFIATQPQGYDTPLGEQGAGLSGGQRQRLSIARALLKNAPILILDEPTAALDRISEDLVFARLRALQPERTMLVIAHRLSTVRSADYILVVHDGRIVAQGRHEELERTSSLYRRMASTLVDDQPVEPLAAAG